MSSSLSLSNVTTLLKRHNYCRHNAYIPGNFAKLFSQLDDAVSNICYVLPPALVIKFTRTLCTGNPWFKDESGKCSLNTLRNLLKCAQCIKRSNCVVSHKEIEPKTFFSAILILAKHCQKTVETSQPPLNVLPVFIITEKSFWFNFYILQGCWKRQVFYAWAWLLKRFSGVLVLTAWSNKVTEVIWKILDTWQFWSDLHF